MTHTGMPLWGSHKRAIAYAVKKPLCWWTVGCQIWNDFGINTRKSFAKTFFKESNISINNILKLIEDKIRSLSGNKLELYGFTVTVRDIQHRLAQEILQTVVNETEPFLVQNKKEVYWQILTFVNNDICGVFFLDAPGGTGNTSLINFLHAKTRQKIALVITTSRIATTILTGQRTAHSIFRQLLNLFQNGSPLRKISKNKVLAKLLKDTNSLSWMRPQCPKRELLKLFIEY